MWRGLLRAKRWANRPPSPARVKMFLGILGACLLIAAIEAFIGWPAWMSTEAVRRPF